MTLNHVLEEVNIKLGRYRPNFKHVNSSYHSVIMKLSVQWVLKSFLFSRS
jgi:hypothetical protein